MKKAVKRGLTQRLRARVRLGDTDTDSESSEEEKTFNTKQKKRRRGKFMSALRLKESIENIATDKTEAGIPMVSFSEKEKNVKKLVEADIMAHDKPKKFEIEGRKTAEGTKPKIHSFQLPKLASGMTSMSMLEQSMPADAVLTKKSAAEVCPTRFPFALFRLLTLNSSCKVGILP